MTEYTATTPVFASTAALDNQVAVDGTWAGLSNFVISGLYVATHSTSNAVYFVEKYVGEPNVPGDVRRLRRSVYEVMRRMGQPVLIKHMYNARDVDGGFVQPSPSFQSAYGQVRNRDPFSYGTGYCSVQTSPNEWIGPNGDIVTSALSPGSNFIPAPMYRGYGPGFLTYIIEPDVAEDIFKQNSAGALINTQSQLVQAPWWPVIGDNDLLINVELDNRGLIVNAFERYQAKKVQPISIRGLDNRGRKETRFGNRHVVNQNFEMARLPIEHTLYQVEIDR